jgi:hypothetical protein
MKSIKKGLSAAKKREKRKERDGTRMESQALKKNRRRKKK